MLWNRTPTATTRLRTIAPFSSCSDRQLADVAANCCPIDVPVGTILCRQGATGSEVFVIASGAATVDVDGIERGRVGSGAIVGELAVLDGGPRTATVVTTEPTTVLVFTEREFEHVLRVVAPVSQAVLATVAARLRRSTRRTAVATA